MEMQSQVEPVPSLDDQLQPTSSSLENEEQPIVVPCNTGDDKIDPFLLSALNNPRDRILLLKLDHELERFVNDTTKQRLEFPPMSSYQRLIVHRVAQYFLLDHAAVDVDNLKRAVVLFKSPQSRVPVLRLTDLREEPDTPPQKAVKIMRRAPNVSGRHNLSLSGGAGEKAQMDKTLEERESEYAKARARIFNETLPATDKPNTNNNSNTTSNINDNNNNNTIAPEDDKTDKPANNIKDSLSPVESNNSTPPVPQKRNTITNPPTKARRNPDGSKYGNDGSVAFADSSSFYSQDPTMYRDKLVYNAKDHLDGDKDRMYPYQHMGHFDSEGLFANGLGLGLGLGMDSYPPIRFDGYDFDYSSPQEVPSSSPSSISSVSPATSSASHPLPPHPQLHPPHPHHPFYGFAGRYGDMAGKGETAFYYDYVPAAKEWTPPSMLSMTSPLSANATPFEPASHSQNHTPSTSSSNSSSSTPSSSSSSAGSANINNTSNTINNFNTINTFNTINNINTINIINSNTSNTTKSPPPSSASSSASSVSALPARVPSTSPPFSQNSSARPPVVKTSSASSIPTPSSSTPSPSVARGNLSRSANSPPSPPPSSISSSSSSASSSSSNPSISSVAFPRTTSPPATSPPPPGALPLPTQIPMQPPNYRNNNNNNNNMNNLNNNNNSSSPFPPFGFDPNSYHPPPPMHPHHPYLPFPSSLPPHPLTHPHLYPPPQFLGPVPMGGAPIYAHHPFLPGPVQKPIASLDYERRPPKSTELFDPKAPPPPKRQPGPQQVEAGMRQMSLYPAPHNSPAQTHLTNQQGVKKNNTLSNSSSSSKVSPVNPKNPQQQSPPPQTLQPKNPSSSSTVLSPTPSLASSSKGQKFSNPSQVSPPFPPHQFQQVPQFSSNPQNFPQNFPQDQTAPRLLYEYPQQQGVYVPPDHTPPPTVAHILEIYDMSAEGQATPSFLDSPVFAELKKAGASIKVLDSSVFIAIFRNGAAARKALEQWENDNPKKGRECGYKLRQWAPALVSGVVPTDSDPTI